MSQSYLSTGLPLKEQWKNVFLSFHPVSDVDKDFEFFISWSKVDSILRFRRIREEFIAVTYEISVSVFQTMSMRYDTCDLEQKQLFLIR
jgi:hypothetical protein